MGSKAEKRLRIGFLLDCRWFAMKNLPERSKERTLQLLVEVLTAAEVPYAIIGGVALQVHSADPRTTVDIDVAVWDRSAIPADALRQKGFRYTGSFQFSENWLSADDIPVQFSSGPDWHNAILNSEPHDVNDRMVRVISPIDLLRAKIDASTDPARRPSKRHIDIGDAKMLIEEHPEIRGLLTVEECSLVDQFGPPTRNREPI